MGINDIEIVYLANPIYGGWVTYTAHLAHVLKKKSVLKSTQRLGKNASPFGYGIFYQNIPKEALPTIKKKIITAIDKKHYDCLPYLDNCILVIHDPTEFSDEIINFIKTKNVKVVTIRETVKVALMKYGIDSHLTKHPFYQYETVKAEKIPQKAVAISRIDFDKHTDIILKANQKLEKPILVYGNLNKMYEFLKLKGLGLQKFYRGQFEKSFQAVSKILSDAYFMVDMSAIKGDGGGTQYTFLEAIHNDCIPVLSSKWFENGTGEMRPMYNCFSVSNEDDLVNVLGIKNDIILANGKELLEAHSGADIVKIIAEYTA